MKNKDVQQLEPGIYIIIWKKKRGSSLAAVGSMADGRRWMAPINWTRKGSASRKYWRQVDTVLNI